MRNVALALLLFFALGSCGAQSATSKPVEPEVIGEAFLLDSSGQTLKPLPEEPWKAQGKPSLLVHGYRCHSDIRRSIAPSA